MKGGRGAKAPRMSRGPGLKIPKPPRTAKIAKRPAKTAKIPKPSKRPGKTAKNPRNPRGSQTMAQNAAMNTMAYQSGSFPRKGVSGAPQAGLVEVQNAAKSLKEVLNLADGKMTRLQQALSEIPQ
jgi:hypothetical protein